MKRKIIFYQSISEIIEILKILKKSKFGSCTIVITGGDYFLDVIKKLKLKKKFGVKTHVSLYLSFKNPINILKTFINLHFNNNTKKIFSYSYDEAIFFNKIIDFITPFYLSKINVKKILFVDCYKFKIFKSQNINLRNIIVRVILKLIYFNSNIKINFCNLISHSYHKNLIAFDLKNLQIKKKFLKISRNQDFLISIGHKTKKKVIYLDSDEEGFLTSKGEHNLGKKISKTVVEILELFESKGFKIFIKKHGRAKLSLSFPRRKNWTYISDFIPIELYKLKESDFLIGYTTSGLSLVFQNNPEVQSISIVKMIPSKIFNFDYVKANYKKFNKSNKVQYPNSIQEIKKII